VSYRSTASVAFTQSIAAQGNDNPSKVIIDITPTALGCSLRLSHEMYEKWADFVDRSHDRWLKMLGVIVTLL
jgi:hypothetical protein